MTGATPIGRKATPQEKQARRREQSKTRQSVFRQRQAESGLVNLNLRITAKAHSCLIELKTRLGKESLPEAITEAVLAQYESTPPLPRMQQGDPIGIKKLSFWVSQEVSDCLDVGDYKHRWHALCAFIIAHHAQVCRGE